MLTAPHVVALGALSTSANDMAGLGQMVLRAFSLEASPEAVVESGTRAATIAEWFLHGSFRLGPVDVPRAQEGASKVADVMIMLICDRCSAVIASFSVAAVPVCSWCGNPRRAL
jgi:hypothetical protein